MQTELEKSDARFERLFLFFNFGWIIISILTLTFAAFSAFSEHPNYFHTWQAPAIFVLMALILVLFCLNVSPYGSKIFSGSTWPPPLKATLTYWGILYLSVTLLCLLDSNFVWVYFIVLGLTFGFFERLLMIALVTIIFLSYSIFLGDLSWPLTSNDLGGLFGNSITYFSLTIVCFTIQHLISERHQRGDLLAQLGRSNEELAAAHQKLAETAAQEQELAVLRERTRLAREMHDTLGHALVLVSVKLEAAQRLREYDPKRCDQELEATKEIVRDSMKELRASIANLRSPALKHEPACNALSRYARAMAQRTGLHITYDLHPNIEDLPETVEETLWKVGQEALTNIERHAQAQNVILHISRLDSQIFMKITDDGIGLPPTLGQQNQENQNDYKSPIGHYGLEGMQERVKYIHGDFSIRSSKETGTSVELALPLVEMPLPCDLIASHTSVVETKNKITENDFVNKNTLDKSDNERL
jgi:signal transduction histidine kinase